MRTFKESIDLSLKDRNGEIEMNQATIEFDGTNYILCATTTEDDRMTLLSNELVNNPKHFGEYIINSSQVQVGNGHYDFSESVLLHTRVEHTQYGAKYQWAIRSFKKVTQSNDEEGYLFYIAAIDKKWRIKGLGDTTAEFEYRHNTYSISQNEENEILIKTSKDNPYKDMVVSLLSLFQGTAMEIRCKEECKEGKKTTSYLPVQYRFSEQSRFTHELSYIEHAPFKDFVQLSLNTAANYTDRTKRDYIVKAIKRYIGSKYVDNQTKFIYLVSILEVIAENVEKIKTTEKVVGKDGKERNCPRAAYDIVGESLTNKNIDLSKLNDTIEESIGLKDFVDLRNEILHRLPSEKITD